MDLVTFKFSELRELGLLHLDTDTVDLMLLGSGYVPSRAHDFASSVAAYELSGAGYAGGYGGSGRRTQDLASARVGTQLVWTGAGQSWPGLDAGTVAAVAFVQRRTSDADSPLLAVKVLASPVDPAGNDLALSWPAGGIFTE